MARRYLFLCPDKTAASGGVAVIYDLVNLLHRAGYEAALLHSTPRFRYPNVEAQAPVYHSTHFRRIRRRYAGSILGRAKFALRMLPSELGSGPNLRYEPRPDDVIVAPEFMMPEALEAFPDHPVCVFVQNPFTLMTMHLRALDRGLDPCRQVRWFFSMAEICTTYLEMLGVDPARISYFPVSMRPEEYPYQAQKEKLITYMPRKRPWEARVIDTVLRARGNLGEYRLEAIDGRPRAEVVDLLARSRFFISLLQTESFGFPAAEAMASGCITIGFTGLGAEPFFDTGTGIPVPEQDVAGLVSAVEAALAEYERDPTRLDALRLHASQRVNARYNAATFEAGVLDCWRNLETVFAD